MPAIERCCAGRIPGVSLCAGTLSILFIMQLLIIPQEQQLHNIFEEAHYSE
jgi:hypothetical protein